MNEIINDQHDVQGKIDDIELLSSIKLNPTMTTQDCERILSLLGSKVSGMKESNTRKYNDRQPQQMKQFNRHIGGDGDGDDNGDSDDHNTDENPNVSISAHSQRIPLKSSFNAKRAFQVVYGKHKPYKKNKEWTYDGFVLIQSDIITLYDSTGKVTGRTEVGRKAMPQSMEEGTRLVIGSFECELYSELDVNEFDSGAYFIQD